MPFAETSLILHAPIMPVWDVMLDFRSYPEWNPFIESIDFASEEPSVGMAITLHVHFNTGDRHSPVERITRIEPPKLTSDGVIRGTLEYEFSGPMHSLYLIRGKRPQIIESRGPDVTAYHTSEELKGLLAFALPIAAVQDGFERHAVALKTRCESLARAGRP